MGRGALLAYNFCIVGFILTGNVISAYENIALNKPAWQQHPYSTEKWGADKAVDGRFTDRRAVGGQCTISAEVFQTAYWWVDLGRVLSIHHINIFYRTANDSSNGYTARFLGFSVYVSNTTNKDNGFLCFKDTTFTRDTIPENFTTECVKHGRYVIYYNERGRSINRPEFSDYAFNELCEVQVLGCPTPGFYGENCNIPSPQNCQERRCNIVNGTCLGCVAGYKGPRCEEQCDPGTYGLECSKTCGNCSDGVHCNHENGSCPSGSDVGAQGFTCDEVISSDSDTNSQCSPSLYGVVATLCLSVALNIFLLTWIFRNGACKRKCQEEKRSKQLSTEPTEANTELYDKVEYNAGYQELGQLSQPSHYDKLQ